MQYLIVTWIVLGSIFSPGMAQDSRMQTLHNEIAQLEAHSGGTIGIWINQFPSGQENYYHSGIQFPMASTYKTPR